MKLLESSERGAFNGVVLTRLMVGAVFLTEGIQKFLLPGVRGPGRFEAIGFPNPELWGYLVGTIETACGVLILLGLGTRFAAVPLFGIMLVAIITTKVPVLLGHGFGPFGVRKLSGYGFFSFTHESRTDWSMLLGSAFLVLSGGGPWSLDSLLGRSRDATSTNR